VVLPYTNLKARRTTQVRPMAKTARAARVAAAR
jgi:hypothetical protein